MHLKEVTQSVYTLRLGTTVVIRVTLSPSSLLHCSPLISSSSLTAQALMEFGLDLREKSEEGGGGEREREVRAMREWGSLESVLVLVLTLAMGFILEE